MSNCSGVGDLVGPRHLDEHAVGELSAAQRERVDQPGLDDAGQRAERARAAPPASTARRAGPSSPSSSMDVWTHEVVADTEAGIDGHGQREAAREEAGAGQQHHRQRHLRDDQRLAGPHLPPAAGAAACAVRQGVGDPDAAGAPGGEHAEHERDTSRRHRRRRPPTASDRHLVQPRRVRRSHRDEHRTAIAARPTPTAAPAPAMVIVSASHWRVIRPIDAPSASWTANSRCRDAARATSRFETLVHATRSSRSEAASSSRSAGRTPAVITSRMGTATASAIHRLAAVADLHRARDAAQLGRRGCDVDPGPDPRDDAEVVRGARRRLEALLTRRPDHRLAGVVEPWRHHADHGVGHAADDDRFAGQRALALPALPEAGPDERHGRGAALQLPGKEPAASRRPRAHDVEEPLRHHRHRHRLRLAGAEDGLRERGGLGHRREAARLRLPVEEVGLRHVGAAPALVADLEQLHDAVGLGVRQGPQQHAVDDA